VARLEPHFKEVIVSANHPERFVFLDARIVRDEAPGQGPLMGIASGLGASRHEVNFVIACDIPRLDFGFVRRMLRRARDFDCVVPKTAAGHLEPLCAVYRKSALPVMRATLAEGKRKISDAFPQCRVAWENLADAAWLRNINTIEDYQTYLTETSTSERGQR